MNCEARNIKTSLFQKVQISHINEQNLEHKWLPVGASMQGEYIIIEAK
jgi:hypothetical protein